jgi:hypothetical protein
VSVSYAISKTREIKKARCLFKLILEVFHY